MKSIKLSIRPTGKAGFGRIYLPDAETLHTTKPKGTKEISIRASGQAILGTQACQVQPLLTGGYGEINGLWTTMLGSCSQSANSGKVISHCVRVNGLGPLEIINNIIGVKGKRMTAIDAMEFFYEFDLGFSLKQATLLLGSKAWRDYLSHEHTNMIPVYTERGGCAMLIANWYPPRKNFQGHISMFGIGRGPNAGARILVKEPLE